MKKLFVTIFLLTTLFVSKLFKVNYQVINQQQNVKKKE